MDEKRIRQIVREELQRYGITEHAKRGNQVDTPHGTGVVLTVVNDLCRVKLPSGAIVKVPRSRCVVKG